MPLDYSKWDALELSDDSDIEVHPNVDKKSFIRAKQAQIHQQRAERKLRIATMKHERKLNAGMITRTDRLVEALKAGERKAKEDKSSTSPDKTAWSFLASLLADSASDKTPDPPEGIYKNNQNPPSFGGLIGTLYDQSKKAVEERGQKDEWPAYIAEVTTHSDKIRSLQKELEETLVGLEEEEKRHITSDDIHTGFDVSHVAKKGETSTTAASSSAPSSSGRTVELLNPGAVGAAELAAKESDVDGDLDGATPLGLKFLDIAEDDLVTSRHYLVTNPQMLQQRETDALLVEAFNSQMEGKEKYAKRCVHHALLAQYCRQLGANGIQIFFARIMDRNHQARGLFYPDVDSTYKRIQERTAAIQAERQDDSEGVEQIQLHPVTPGTTINITVPDVHDIDARKIFDSFDPILKTAIENKDLDLINAVLGRMTVEKAEDVVAKLSEGGMLNVEEQVIDATTEEGQEVLHYLEEQARQESQADKTDEPAADPATK